MGLIEHAVDVQVRPEGPVSIRIVPPPRDALEMASAIEAVVANLAGIARGYREAESGAWKEEIVGIDELKRRAGNA